MELGTLLFLLLLVACPLAMVWMMRGHGGHASHGAGHGCGHGQVDEKPCTPSLDELRARRDEIEAQIEELELAESAPRTPVGA